ncbi:MAG TPA: glycosyltransferase family A protein [Candidatus Anoxymicrobiaceae bacterium]
MSRNLSLPLLTIGLPVFNGEVTLSRALESLLAQTYGNFELIIFDNASTDGTKIICEGYKRRDPRVTYNRNEVNVGALANFNSLLKAGKGSLFMWAACDDSWEPEFLEELVGLLDANPEAVLAFCQIELVQFDNGQRYPVRNSTPLGRQRSIPARLVRFLLFPELESKACMIYGVIRRHTLLEVGGLYKGFEEGQAFGHDNQTLFLLAMRGTFAISGRVLFNKGIYPITDLRTVMTNPHDIRLNYKAYRKHISESEMTGFQKAAVSSAAFANYCRKMTRQALGRALLSLNFRSLEPLYHRSLLKAPGIMSRLRRP